MTDKSGAHQANSTEQVNAAKHRLLKLEEVEKSAASIAGSVAAESHFITRFSVFLIIGEAVILLFSIGEVYSCLVGSAPFDNISLLSLLVSIALIGVLWLRLSGWWRVKRNEKQLHNLRREIEKERTDAEKIIAD